MKLMMLVFGFMIFAMAVSGIVWAQNDPSEIGQDVQKEISDKERLAVLDFGGEVDNWIIESLTNKFENEIVNLRRFQVISRRNIKEVEEELNLSITGMIDDAQALEVGNMLAAQKLIAGQIQFYNEKFDEDSEEYKIKMTIGIKIIGIEQGVVLTGFDVKITSSNTDKEAAISEAIDDAISQFIEKIQKIYSLEARIIKTDGGEAIINMGRSDGIEKGMFFEVYRLTEEIADLRTDEILGQEEEYVGIIKIKLVKPKFAKAKIVKGRRKITDGDKIKEAVGLGLPKWNLFLLYSTSTVDAPKNKGITGEDLTSSQCYALGMACQLFNPVFLEGQAGPLKMGEINGFSADLSVKLKIPVIHDLLDGYIGGGYSYSRIYQDIPRSVETDDDKVSNEVYGYSGSLELRLKPINLVKAGNSLMNLLQPFAKISYRHYEPMDEWKVVSNKTGEEMIIDDQLPYSSIDINDVAFQFGVVLIGW